MKIQVRASSCNFQVSSFNPRSRSGFQVALCKFQVSNQEPGQGFINLRFPFALAMDVESPTGARPRSRSRSPLQPEDSQLPSPMRPVAHSDTMKSTTGVGSPEPRVRLRSRSGSSERSGFYFSPMPKMRPVAHDSPIPAKNMKINIKTQGGKTITLEVEEFDTINNVKDALDLNHGIAACRGKSLMQDCAGRANMWQLGIYDGDTLHLVDPPPSGNQPRVTEAAATSHNAPVHRGPEIPGHPGCRRISLQRFERMHGLDVTDSPESDAMANAPAEAPVRTAPED